MLGIKNTAGVSVLQKYLNWSANATDLGGTPFPAAQQRAAEIIMRTTHTDLLGVGAKRVSISAVSTGDLAVMVSDAKGHIAELTGLIDGARTGSLVGPNAAAIGASPARAQRELGASSARSRRELGANSTRAGHELGTS